VASASASDMFSPRDVATGDDVSVVALPDERDRFVLKVLRPTRHGLTLGARPRVMESTTECRATVSSTA